MAYFSTAKLTEIKNRYPHTMDRKGLDYLLTELAAAEAAEYNKFKAFYFAGAAQAGQVSVSGTLVGDKILAVVNLTDSADGAAKFESAVTVKDKIVQSAAEDLSAKKFMALVYRP